MGFTWTDLHLQAKQRAGKHHQTDQQCPPWPLGCPQLHHGRQLGLLSIRFLCQAALPSGDPRLTKPQEPGKPSEPLQRHSLENLSALAQQRLQVGVAQGPVEAVPIAFSLADRSESFAQFLLGRGQWTFIAIMA